MIFLRFASSILKSGKFNRFSVILPKAIRTISEKQDENLSKPINVSKKVTKEKFSNSAEYHEMRCRQKHQFKEGGRNPYPHDFEVTISLEDFVNKYANNLENGQALKDDIVSVRGRIFTIRKSSSKLIFYVLRERKVHLQIIADATSYFSKGEFLEITDMLKRGDVIGIKGYPYRSNSGELSILAINMQMIALCLHLIPDSYYGLKNIKTRFKERCVDLFMNVSSQEALIIHSDIRTFLRNYLAFHKFFDADTPKFSKIPGGANAKPFKTHYNGQDMDLYLRVSPELYLKKLCVGGFKRVFEIGPVFRNEGIDRSHHPEFMTCEFYMTDGSHNNLLKFVENLLTEMIKKIKGSCIFKYNSCGKEYDIDFTPPFKRIKIWPALEEALDMKLPDPKTLYSAEANQIFSNLCIKHDIECASPRTTARLINKLIEHFLEQTLINPTFLCEHPEIISPLAKSHPEVEGLTQRFEMFVMGMEIVNAYTELNDPEEQRKRFETQSRDRAAGDQEALQIDEDYLRALEYGLPITHGCGIGIDRLAMLLANVSNITEVLSFPFAKTE